LRPHVVPEHASGPVRRMVKSEKRMNESGLPGPVGAEKSDGTSLQRAGQISQDFALSEANAQTLQFDYCAHLSECRAPMACEKIFGNSGIPPCPGAPSSVPIFMPKKLPVLASVIRSGSP